MFMERSESNNDESQNTCRFILCNVPKPLYALTLRYYLNMTYTRVMSNQLDITSLKAYDLFDVMQ